MAIVKNAVGGRGPFVRSARAGELIEAFLIAGISSVLLTRFFLAATGYPQLGGSNIHIAHVLPGGLLMLVGVLLLLSFLNREARMIGAIVGGLGFGLFIDEVGKFVTTDVNYFFEPAIAMIYVVFVALFVLLREFGNRASLSEREYLVNALEEAKEVAAHDLDEREKQRALRYLAQAGRGPLVAVLRRALLDMDALRPGKPNPFRRLLNWLEDVYENIIKRRWFGPVLIGLFVTASVVAGAKLFVDISAHEFRLSFTDGIRLASSATAGICVLVGVAALTESRVAAYRWFRRSVIISILFTQVFLFVEDQLSAIVGLSFNLAALLTLQEMIAIERRRSKD